MEEDDVKIHRLPRPEPAEPLFEIHESPIHGRGGFAVRPIPKGTRIVEYTGERVSHKEANRRYNDAVMKRHHTFLFTIDEKTVVDAGVGGSDARFINHSCEPNCEAVIEDDRIFIEALRNIRRGEELFYDYAYEVDEPLDPETARARYPCRCGTPSCRGTILHPDWIVKPKTSRAARKRPARRSG
jgi:SET domain-containing protein